MDFIEFKKRYERVTIKEKPNSVFSQPLVSVCVQTYQHVNFIKACLDSILKQETNFQFEILLGEDASNDGTREICLKYAERNPNKIRLFLHHRENNISIDGSPTGRFVFLTNLFKARGKYIALCEGDDFWSDLFKLQKQVDFLENNTGYSACFTNAEIMNEDSGVNKSYLNLANNKTFPLDEIIRKGGGLFPTASLLFRNIISSQLPSFMVTARSGDRALSLILGNNGSFYYLKDKTCVYRQHQGGIFSSNIEDNIQRKKIHLNNIMLLQEFNEYSKNKYQKIIKKTISKLSKKAFILKPICFEKEQFNLLANLNFRDFLSLLKFLILKS